MKKIYAAAFILFLISPAIVSAEINFTAPATSIFDPSIQPFIDRLGAPFVDFEKSIEQTRKTYLNDKIIPNTTIPTIQNVAKQTPQFIQNVYAFFKPFYDIFQPVIRVVGGFILVTLRLAANFILSALSYLAGSK